MIEGELSQLRRALVAGFGEAEVAHGGTRAGGVPAKDWDLAYFISAPGRFPLDAGAGGHMDLGGVMMELTASPGDTTDPQYGPKLRWSRAGSWEGHAANSKLWQFAVMTKYGKTGMRCARD